MNSYLCIIMAKILLIRFSSIGDIVLTTPVIRILHNSGHKVVFLTKEKYASVIIHNPYIDTVITLKSKVSEVAQVLKNQNIDYVIDLHRNLRSLQVKLLLKKGFSSFHKLNFKKWILVVFKWNFLPEKHIVDRYLYAAHKFYSENDYKGLDYFSGLHELPKLMNAVNFKIDKYVVLALGGQHKTKQLPIGKLMEICDKLVFPIVLLGGREDAETSRQISYLSINTHVLDLCGKTSINESAEIISECAAIITHDTGMMHIAAAYKRNIVSVWGNTVPEFGMYPYLPNEYSQRSVIIENKQVKCRPCSKIGYDRCPKGHFHCMEYIDTDDIVAAVQQFVVGF